MALYQPAPEERHGDGGEPRGSRHRADLLDYLRSLGATEEQIVSAESHGKLAELGADLVLRRADALSAADVARIVGVPVETVTGMWQALGIPVEDPEARMFSHSDTGVVQGLLSAKMFAHTSGDELLRVLGSSVATVADAAVSLYVQDVESDLEARGATSAELAEKSAEAVLKGLELATLLDKVFAHHLRAAVERQRRAQSQVADRALFRLAVGFVDLVGFTQLSGQMEVHELTDFVRDLESRSFRIATERGGRVVKHIGDEIMFVAIDPVAGCEIALCLVEEFGAGGPKPRGGVSFGDVVTRHGDYYGSVVNLASRLTDLAIPGEVLVDASLPGAIGGQGHGSLEFASSGRRQPKGFDAPVTVYSVEPSY
jgi:adenylate cyclase